MLRFHSPATRRSAKLIAWFTIAAGLLLLQSCATQPPPPGSDLPGFFSGFLHGFLIVFGFIGSLVTDYRIYAYPNSGFWYDFGYLLGAMMFLGGSGAGAGK